MSTLHNKLLVTLLASDGDIRDLMTAIQAIIDPELAAKDAEIKQLRGLLDELRQHPDGWCSHQHITMAAFGRVVAEKNDARAQRAEAVDHARKLEAAIDRVLELHRQASHGSTCVYCARLQSLGYDTDWPCDTIRALDEPAQQGDADGS